MIASLDTNIVIYLIERPAVWGPKVVAYLAPLIVQGWRIAVSDLVRMECRVGPIRTGDAARLARFDTFFNAGQVVILPLDGRACDQAARIRAMHRFSTPDALNLAASAEAGCDLFVTNALRLAGFRDLAIATLA